MSDLGLRQKRKRPDGGPGSDRTNRRQGRRERAGGTGRTEGSGRGYSGWGGAGGCPGSRRSGDRTEDDRERVCGCASGTADQSYRRSNNGVFGQSIL
ncbi:hypothetical protein D3Z62_07565 [Lachnospiraceae bacterium]|nr:hypothetical protein [Lachnospiraceae bacterium]